MDLINIYTDYNLVNKNIIEYLNKVLSDDTLLETKASVEESISTLISSMEDIKMAVDLISINIENKDNLNDLKYLIHSTLFLLGDLEHFYKLNELSRFKMRAVNYINHSRRK